MSSAEFSRHRRDLWEELGQILFVESLSHPQEADDIQRAVWRVSKRLSRENLKTRTLRLDFDVSQIERENDHEVKEFLSRLSDHERALVQLLLDETPLGVSDPPEQKKRLRSSIRRIREKFQKYFEHEDRPS